ncbi:TPA: helix-turn-helix domain-containing protein [Raoultella planticola]|nr:helix-turn-helix domain-containing protein [Raoultella planticola]OZP75883.1 transcriptional regulator [Raoultella planticola]HEC2625681.1 helix-turn-helix domain-containing protein [Raoultella planticola]
MGMKKLTFNDRITSRRKELGLTQQQLADAIGISGVSVYKWEAGINTPKGHNLFSLAEALRCSPAWLLNGTDDDEPLKVDELLPQLDNRQKLLLDLFDSLPESEKERHINELRDKVEGFQRLFDELLLVKKQKNTPKK